MRSAQISLEFMYAIVMLLFVTTVIFVVVGNKLSDFKNERDLFLLKDVAATVKNEIDVAHAMAPGYVRNFELAETLEGENYSISLGNGFVTAALSEKEFSLAVQSVNGSVLKGSNIIRKVDGDVILN